MALRKINILMLACFLFMIQYASALSFDISNFSDVSGKSNLKLYGKASVSSNGVMHLTGPGSQIFMTGRATYGESVHLWDAGSGNLTDFTSHIVFVMDSGGSSTYGDGIAFFLAPTDFPMPPAQEGSGLGLLSGQQIPDSTEHSFVAVEFDTVSNQEWDPAGNHVGIDVNSLRSVSNVTWQSDITAGKRNEAWVVYNSTTKSLSVNFTGFVNGSKIYQSLSHDIDLRRYLPEWVSIGISAATGSWSESHDIESWSFSSTLEMKKNQTPSGLIPTVGPEGKSIKTTLLAVGLSAGSVFILCVGLVSFFLWRKRGRRDEENGGYVNESMEDDFERGTGPKKFSYKELATATSNFKDDGKLGQGGFGGVYRGFLQSVNSHVAVKRVSRGSKQGIKEYTSEVRIISRLRHRNLVQLIGWCHENRELLLVYEFMPNGSLDMYTLRSKSLLPWDARYKIARGLASALLYLHEEWEQCVVHRDIKSSNVMLDSNFNAKLGDFGLARLVDHGKDSQTTIIAGTMGYMAPECMVSGKANAESDVYSCGIVALEIACGRKPVDPSLESSQVNLVEWVWNLYGTGRILEAADPKLYGTFDHQEMERLMVVGLWCAHPDSNVRPSVRQVIHVLDFEAPLPLLPLNMPVATFLTLPSLSHDRTKSLNNSSYHISSHSTTTTSSAESALLHTF